MIFQPWQLDAVGPPARAYILHMLTVSGGRSFHSHQQRIVSYVTATPRSSNNSSMSPRLRLNRKYQRTPQLMTTGKPWPGQSDFVFFITSFYRPPSHQPDKARLST